MLESKKEEDNNTILLRSNRISLVDYMVVVPCDTSDTDPTIVVSTDVSTDVSTADGFDVKAISVIMGSVLAWLSSVVDSDVSLMLSTAIDTTVVDGFSEAVVIVVMSKEKVEMMAVRKRKSDGCFLKCTSGLKILGHRPSISLGNESFLD